MKLASEITHRDEIIHDAVVRDIAEHRFGLPEWEVTTMPVDAGLPAVPDIMATFGDSVVAVGEVEVGDVCSKRAQHWKALGDSCVRFYLYVPDSSVEMTCRLISEHKIACAGLRSYKYNGKLEIEPVYFENAVCRDDDHPWWMAIGGTEKSC